MPRASGYGAPLTTGATRGWGDLITLARIGGQAPFGYGVDGIDDFSGRRRSRPIPSHQPGPDRRMSSRADCCFGGASEGRASP